MSPKAFTKHERLMIRAKLHEKGRDLMAHFGIRKTIVEDMTKAVGISKGSFYLFYDSKEELFLEILEAADTEIRVELWKGFSAEGDKRKLFKQAFRNVLRLMEKMPMLARLSSEEFQYLFRKLPPELTEEKMKKDHDVIENFIAQLIREGKIRKGVDLEVAAGLFRAISMIILQREAIGKLVFDQVFDKIMDGAIAYLVEEVECEKT